MFQYIRRLFDAASLEPQGRQVILLPHVGGGFYMGYAGVFKKVFQLVGSIQVDFVTIKTTISIGKNEGAICGGHYQGLQQFPGDDLKNRIYVWAGFGLGSPFLRISPYCHSKKLPLCS